MSEHQIESEQRFLGLGISSDDYKFISTEPEFLSSEVFADDTVYSFNFAVSLDLVLHHRAIYSVWDFLGDVGGLFDMLKFLAYPITLFFSTLIQTGVDQYLLSTLFQMDKSSRGSKDEDLQMHIN